MGSIEQKQEVMKWLETLFGGGSIPQLDCSDERSISKLYKLKQNLTESERDANVLADFQKIQIAEYQNEIDRITTITRGIGIDLDSNTSFENEPLENLISILAEVSGLLGVDNPSEDDLDIALADLRLKASDTHVVELLRQQKLKKEKEEMLDSINSLSHTENALQVENDEAKIQVDVMNNLRKKTAFLTEKLKEYSKSLESHKVSLRKNGYRKEILLENLLNLKKELDDMEEKELNPKQIKLLGYNGLPPSIELAKAKVAEAENQLESLVQELTREISAVHV